MSTRTDFTYAAYLDEKSSNAGFEGFTQWLHIEYGKRIAELEQEVDRVNQTLNSAVQFLVFGDPADHYAIYVHKCFGHRLPKEPMWKVMCGPSVLGKNGRWTYEPQPSSRDDEFYAMFRFDSFGTARDAAVTAGQVSRDIQRAREAARV